MKTIYQHISDPSTIRPKAGETVEGIHVIAYGSTIGRFLFTEWSPLCEIRESQIELKNCNFESTSGGPVCIQVYPEAFNCHLSGNVDTVDRGYYFRTAQVRA